MRYEGLTLKEAAREWVRGFNAIPTQMIYKLWMADTESWQEVTAPEVSNRVCAYSHGSGEIVEVDYENYRYKVELDSGNTVWADKSQIEVEHVDLLPMWDTMWSFGDNLDNYWLDDEDGIVLMSKCGFRIYKSCEFGYFFGINGAGYDFYESHWIPLYNERGLKWHDTETDESTD